MKYLTTLLFVLALLCASYVQADEPNIDMAVISKPIVIKGGTSELMNVTFNHKSHRKVGNNIPCQRCHHETSADIPYSSCTESCHSTPGARERDSMSMFMAFHSPDPDRSCYGCHTSLAQKEPEKYPQFQNCRPCHVSPEARNELARTAK